MLIARMPLRDHNLPELSQAGRHDRRCVKRAVGPFAGYVPVAMSVTVRHPPPPPFTFEKCRLCA